MEGCDREPPPTTTEEFLARLPKWNSGGQLVDISDREELYRVMDEYDGTLDLYRSAFGSSRGTYMSNLNNDEIQALAKAVGLTLSEPELSQVTHSLNAMLEEMAAINPPGFNLEEYLAVTHPADMEVAE